MDHQAREGRYETQDVEFSRVYRWWCPECVVVECDCGGRSILTASVTTCHRAARTTQLSSERSWPPDGWRKMGPAVPPASASPPADSRQAYSTSHNY